MWYLLSTFNGQHSVGENTLIRINNHITLRYLVRKQHLLSSYIDPQYLISGGLMIISCDLYILKIVHSSVFTFSAL